MMQRRQFLLAAGGAGAALLLPSVLSAAPSLYERSVVIDGLGFPGGLSGDPRGPLLEQELQDVKHSGLTATHITMGKVGTMPPLEAFESIVRSIARWESHIDKNPAILARVRQAGDIRQAQANGRAGLIYGLQDGVAFEDDLGRMDALYQLGVRVIQPTYNRRNLLGDGCMEPDDAGLSRTGEEAIERLDELGIMIDLSHCGRRTTADALSIARKPVSFTHTGCHALAEHPRHRTDAEMKRVADSGGVIGIYIMPYLSRGRQPTAADVIAHIEHALGVVGPDHVSIGTDGMISAVELTDEYRERFAGNIRDRAEAGIAAPFETEEGYLFASDLNTPRRLETLADKLLARGHGENTVTKILGANLLRVFEASWSTPS